MSLEQLTTLDAVGQFLDSTQAVAFCLASSKQERYQWVQKNLVKYRYMQLSKAEKGLVTQLLIKVTGYFPSNGGEYINYSVAELLETLRIELTKSRPRHSNDNPLVESKNASVVRKIYGYSHIPQQYAKYFHALNSNFLISLH